MFRRIISMGFLAGALVAGHAHAAQIAFSGVVTQVWNNGPVNGPVVGETLDGAFSFTIQPAIVGQELTDGTTYDSRLASNYLGTNPGLVVSGFVSFSSGLTIDLPSASTHTMAYENVYRNYDIGFNDVEYGIATTGTSDGTDNGVSAWAFDHAGLATSLFADSTRGISFEQGIDTDGAGLTLGGYFQGTEGAAGWFNGLFTATSLSITPDVSVVPEPDVLSLLLAGMGLVAVTARRRTHAERA